MPIIFHLFYQSGPGLCYRAVYGQEGWLPEQYLGGALGGRPLATKVFTQPKAPYYPFGDVIIQVFYRSMEDASLRTRWLNPDGSWSDEQNLGGLVLGNSLVAVMLGDETNPWQGILQLFYTGVGDNLCSRWRNEDGGWSDEQNLGGAIQGDPIALVYGGQVFVFYWGLDYGLHYRVRRTTGEWSAELQIVPGGILRGVPVGAIVPGVGIQLFYSKPDNALYSRWLLGDGETWSDEQNLGGFVASNPAVGYLGLPSYLDGHPEWASHYNTVQLFYRGAGNALWSRWRNDDGSWSGEQNLGGGPFLGDPIVWYGAPFGYGYPDGADAGTAGQPSPGFLQVFYLGTNSFLYTKSRNPDGSWSGEQLVADVLEGPLAGEPSGISAGGY